MDVGSKLIMIQQTIPYPVSLEEGEHTAFIIMYTIDCLNRNMYEIIEIMTNQLRLLCLIFGLACIFFLCALKYKKSDAQIVRAVPLAVEESKV